MPFPWSKAIFSSRVISWSTRSARRSGESVLSIHGPCTDGVSASARERPRSKMAMTRIKTTKSSAARNPELTRLGFFACKAITSWLRSLAGPIITLFWLKLRGKIEQAGCPCPLRSSLRSLCSCKFLPAMRMILAAFALLAANHLMAAPPEGIPRDLARQRAAEISDLRYDLRFTLIPHASSASGHEDLKFRASSSEVILIDFREGSVTNLTVNGAPVPAKIDNGHIKRSEEHTSELQSRLHLVCRLLLEKKKIN